MPSITVFTPTYNRESKLAGLYRSLASQSDTDFVWLVVDDGSTDETCSLIRQCATEASFPIRYLYQKNQGKYVAHNLGVKMTKTDLFVCVDSDDILLPDAIQKTKELWKKYENNPNIAGIVSPRKLPSNQCFVNPPEMGTLSELYSNKVFAGDTMLVYRTCVLQKYPFPEYLGERFMTESVLYQRIDQFYKLVYQNEFLYSTQYFEDGLSYNLTKHRHSSPNCVAHEFRTTSVLHPKWLDRCKAYGALLGWCQLYRLDANSFGIDIPRVSVDVAMCGRMLKKHYYDYFRKEANK